MDRDTEKVDRDTEKVDRDTEKVDRDTEKVERDTEKVDRDTKKVDRDTKKVDRDTEKVDRDTEKVDRDTGIERKSVKRTKREVTKNDHILHQIIDRDKTKKEIYGERDRMIVGYPEVTANLYCYFAYLYWEGCVNCSIYLR